jgi:hypothetical protein
MSTRPEVGQWICGESPYQQDRLVERARVAESTGHTTVAKMGKAHRIRDRGD